MLRDSPELPVFVGGKRGKPCLDLVAGGNSFEWLASNNAKHPPALVELALSAPPILGTNHGAAIRRIFGFACKSSLFQNQFRNTLRRGGTTPPACWQRRGHGALPGLRTRCPPPLTRRLTRPRVQSHPSQVTSVVPAAWMRRTTSAGTREKGRGCGSAGPLPLPVAPFVPEFPPATPRLRAARGEPWPRRSTIPENVVDTRAHRQRVACK